MSIIIKPSVGRKVWYFATAAHYANFLLGQDQPYDATVLYVHGDRCVNLQVISHHGEVFNEMGATLVQPDVTQEPNGAHARWMDYQVQQELTRAARNKMADQLESTALTLLETVQSDSSSDDSALTFAAGVLNGVAQEVSIDTTAQQVESLAPGESPVLPLSEKSDTSELGTPL